jgi:peptidoglycan/xylan/chitin deacetylase (PgdA/CDA1 family)
MLHLAIGIDTESDNQWVTESRLNPTYENIYALPRLHDLFRRCGARPTYLVTYPVIADSRSAETIRGLMERGDCEIGAHHHVWETPPCDPDEARGLPYALQIAIDRFEHQLRHLTDAIAKATGIAPVSYRSGRYGFASSHTAVLERAGYLVDTSVHPLLYESHKGGPDFVDAPLTPYFLSYDSAIAPGSSSLLEVPISAALNRTLPRWAVRAYGRAPAPYHTKRFLRLARIVKTCWLRPSYSSLDDMKHLARRMVKAGAPVLNVMFHSSEAIVGGSPYNKTEGELDAFFERLSQFLQFAVRELGAQPATLREFHREWTARLPGLKTDY